MKKIKKYLKKIKYKFIAKNVLKYENKIFLDNTVFSEEIESTKEAIERDIIVYSHTIEKGLSHFKIKPLFGYSNAKKLYELLLKYEKYNKKDKYVLNLGISSIEKYNEINIKLGVDKSELFNIPDSLIINDLMDVGAYAINEKEFFSKNKMDFENFAKSRHSVRLYDIASEQINEDDLFKSIELAQTAPSACNRQGVKVSVVLDKEKIKKISSIQGGSNGFGENSGAFIIIKVDLKKYQIQERRIPSFDAGLFAMNLLYSLHFNKFGVCILNGSFSNEQTNEIKKIIDIKDSELIVSILAVSKIPNNKDILVAKSIRRATNDIVEVIK